MAISVRRQKAAQTPNRNPTAQDTESFMLSPKDSPMPGRTDTVRVLRHREEFAVVSDLAKEGGGSITHQVTPKVFCGTNDLASKIEIGEADEYVLTARRPRPRGSYTISRRLYS